MRQRVGVAALWLCTCLTSSAGVLADGIRLGIENHTWNSLYGGGAGERAKQTFYERNLDQYARLGADWNVVRVDQTTDGKDGFKRLDRILREHERRKIDVVLRLIEDPAVYAELSTDGLQEGGRVAAYAKWITALTRFVGKRVTTMLIGNEVDKDLSANLPKERRTGPIFVDYAAYKRLLATAHRAIKEVDPAIQVGDHGVESYSLLSAVLSDMFDAGQDEAAVALCHQAFWGRTDYQHECGAFKRRLRFDAALKSRTEKARLSFADPGPADLFQVHLYISADAIGIVLDWIARMQQRNGSKRPLIATEVGYLLPASRTGGQKSRVADRSLYSEPEHAAELSKAIAVLAGRGVAWIQVWELRTLMESTVPVATLLMSSNDPTHIVSYAAAGAFQHMAAALVGKVPVTRTYSCEGPCRQYTFAGDDDLVTVAWSDGGISTLSLPTVAGLSVVDVLGHAMAPHSSSLHLSTFPVIISQGSRP